MSSRPSEWASISVRQDVVERINVILRTHRDLGYGSVADFIHDAVREQIARIQQRKLSERQLAEGLAESEADDRTRERKKS